MKCAWLSMIVLFFHLVTGCATGAKAPTPPIKTVAESHSERKTEPPAEPAVAPPAEDHEPQTTCVHESDTRVLHLQARGGGCNLNYTKYGKTASVAKSTSGTDACEKVQQKIRAKLESVGYTCR